MGFRNPFRITVDDDDVAYITDYSPDSQTPTVFRGPAGTGRMMVVRQPANYGWPLCYSPDLPYYRWNFNTTTPLDNPPQAHECNNPARGPENTSRWNTGLTYSPPIARAGALVLVPGQQPDHPAGHAVRGVLHAEPAGHLPAAVPGARHRRRRPARRGEVRLRPGATRTRPSSPSTTTTPSSSASSPATTCGRSGWTRTATSSRSTTCSTAARRRPRRPGRSSATTRWT